MLGRGFSTGRGRHGRLCGEWEGKINMENALNLYDGQCLRKNALTASSTAVQPIFQMEKLGSVSRRLLHRRSVVFSKKLYSDAVSVSLENECSCGADTE